MSAYRKDGVLARPPSSQPPDGVSRMKQYDRSLLRRTSSEKDYIADRLISEASKRGARGVDQVALRSEMNEARNQARQRALAINKLEPHLRLLGQVFLLSPEEALIEKQSSDVERKAVLEILKMFPSECDGRMVIIAVLKGAEWSSVQDLAEKTNFSSNRIKAAKAKIKYRVNSMIRASLVDYLRRVSTDSRSGGGHA